MKKIKNINKGLPIILGVIVIWLIYYNMRYNSNFFDTPSYAIINIGIAIGVAYYLTQRKNDERKLKEKAEEIINKIQRDINDNRSYEINKQEDIKWCLIIHRQINNRIEILENLSDKLQVYEDVEYIRKNFNNYKELFGNHVNDLTYLKKSKVDFIKFTSNMDYKLDVIKIKLYCEDYDKVNNK
ncbi:MAG: hypothetical protein ACRC7N_10300 [Clostridium sp.]